MLRTSLLVTAGVAATAGILALIWTALAFAGPHTWRATNDLLVPAVGVGGVALLVAALVCLRFSGRTGRSGDPAHAIDASLDG